MPNADSILARVPPHSEQAERAVLGAILLDDSCLPLVRSVLSPADFYVEAHRAIFAAQVDLGTTGTRIDAITLSDRLRALQQFDRIGGAAYLDGLIDAVPRLAAVEDEAAIIARLSRVRHAILAASQIVAAGFEADADPTALSAAFSDASVAVLPRLSARRPAEILRAEIAGDRTNDVRFHLAGTDATGKPADLGEMLGEIAPGQKVIIGGRTSEGKTALLRSFWLAAGLADTPAAYISLEDSDREVVAGAAGAASWLSTRGILSRRWTDSSRAEAERIATWLDRLPLHVAYLSTPTIDEIAQAIRWQVARNGVRVVVVDYLQKVRGGTSAEGRVVYLGRALAEMSRAVRGAAVLVIGSQLRRAPQGAAKDRPPAKEDLRDSGEIEEDAKAVVLLRRAGEDLTDPRTGARLRRVVTLDLAKNKLGPTGTMAATLWLRHTSLWPGVRRPWWDLTAGPTQREGDGLPVEDEAPEWVQSEMGGGEWAEHAGEDNPF